MRNTRLLFRVTLFALATAQALAWGPAATAAPAATARTPARSRASLERLARSNNMASYTRTCNGVKRTYVNATQPAQAQALMQKYNRASNVLQICHINRSGLSHSMAIFDGKLVHFQYLNGTRNWRLRPWGNSLRVGRDDLHTALIQLKPSEAGRLRTMLAASEREQGPEHAAGPRWDNGKVKDGMGRGRYFDCTTVWTGAKIGDRGETLANLVGVSSTTPRGFQAALENNANDRVFGVCVVGPTPQPFGNNPTQQLFGR